MSQPNWKFFVNLGDADPIEHGGFFVYVDETGVYDPMVELLEPPIEFDEDEDESEASRWTVYRFDLERCTLVNGVLSDNPYHPEIPAWFARYHPEIPARFARKIDFAADTCGVEPAELRAQLCSEDAIQRARGYQTLVAYFGSHQFDPEPLLLTREEAEARYAETGDES